MIVAAALSNWIALSFHLSAVATTGTLSTRKICLVNCFLIGFSGLFLVSPDIFPSFLPVWLVFPFDISSLGGGVFFLFMNGKRIKAFWKSQREEKIYRFGKIFFCYFFQETVDRFSFNETKLSIGLTY